jgi:hypothetical protein
MEVNFDDNVKDLFIRMGAMLLSAQHAYEKNDFLELRCLLKRIRGNTYSLEDIAKPDNFLQMNIKTYSELSHEDIEVLDTLNEHLQALEQKICKEAKKQTEHAKHRLTSQGDNNLDCFHIEIDISYHTEDDDPVCLENGDRYIVMKNDYFTGEFDDDLNHVEIPSHHPLKNKNYCYLFHCLYGVFYSHLYLPWSDILRIRHVFAHVKAVYGHEIHMTTESLFSKGE